MHQKILLTINSNLLLELKQVQVHLTHMLEKPLKAEEKGEFDLYRSQRLYQIFLKLAVLRAKSVDRIQDELKVPRFITKASAFLVMSSISSMT